MKAEELDRLFEKGEEDILPYLDLAKAVRPGHEAKRVNVDFPQWMLARLDIEADRLGVPRQSLIKVWIAERLTLTRQKRLAESGGENSRHASRFRR
ncbi:MAG TPA: CopG family transcriptional regulator [Verrucomicrobiota bacterium]|nr:CopG family transcriptional regulator [Verrucomicrobiota bacterium]HRZ37350.1 CopG family transcriptional regulator [Candidatus Paceibacterota bacterium]HRZ56618.1 CopG family transcriptional regulator [Candidatus Paceibacterota bacterium]